MKYLLILCLTLSALACGQTTEPEAPAREGALPASSPEHENLTPEEFAEKMDDERVVLLDVRTPPEIAAGKIDGALELDFKDPDFAAKLNALDKEATYLVYCAVGGRSNKACTMMTEAGFDRVYNLEGGFTAWQQR